MDRTEALNEAYAELERLLPKEYSFVTSACLDDQELIDRLDLVYDLGSAACGTAFLFALRDGCINDEKEAESLSRIIDQASFTYAEHEIFLSLIKDIRESPEKLGIPKELHGYPRKPLAWVIANLEKVADPRARVIEKRKMAAKKAIDAISVLRERMEMDRLRRNAAPIN